MDARRFDTLARSLTEAGTRRGLLGLLATLPVLGGLVALLDPDETDAKGRRKRRVKRHKHRTGKRKDNRKGKHKKQPIPSCTPDSTAQTCTGRCGSVTNNCNEPVDCGPCACEPPCPTCQTCDAASTQCVPDAGAAGTSCAPCRACDGAGACVTCATCCDDVCCTEAGSICRLDSGACCVPESPSQTCAEACGSVTNNCGQEVDCGDCTCNPTCPVCQSCDPATGACVPSGNGDACDDGDLCLTGSTCSNGTCGGGSPVVCNTPTECQTGPGACDPSSGQCTYPAKSDGTRCGDKCTQACTAGVCGASTPVSCPATECQTAGTCDPGTGLCSVPTNDPNGTSCSTGRCCDGVCPPASTCLSAHICCENADACVEDCCTHWYSSGVIPVFCPSTFQCAARHNGNVCGRDNDCGDRNSICVCGTCCGGAGTPCSANNHCCSGVCPGHGICA